MTAKTMAEVLAELDAHKPTHAEYTGGWWELACTGCDFANGRRLSHLDWTPHHAHRAEIFAAALSAAGFGLVADAKAEALEEAADELDRQERFGRLPWNELTDEQRAEYRSWARLETNQAFLRACAAAMRGDS